MTGQRTSDPRDVVFYQLTTKFVDNEQEIPEESREVLYYSLAIGHHTGIIDCLSEKIRCPQDVFSEVVEALPESSDARYKLEGIMRHGEIQVDKTHLEVLDPAIQGLVGTCVPAVSDSGDDEGEPRSLSHAAQAWLVSFADALESIKEEPSVYLMGRVVAS